MTALALAETPTDDPPETSPTLDAKHREELYASGLTDETIETTGIYSAENAEIRKILAWQPKEGDWGRGMIIPFWTATGEPSGHSRVKLDYARLGSGDDGKVIKYESPRKAPNRAYFPPGFGAAFKSQEPTVIVEGEKKALSVSQRGIACIGLVGVYGFQKKRKRSDLGRAYGRRELIDDLGDLGLKGRQVVIVFDSDAETNPQVQLAEFRLAEVLTKVGASVRVARLPALGDGKTGVDDFLVHHGDAGPAEFRALLSQAQPPEEPKKPSVLDWARMLVDDHFRTREGTTLVWWRDEFYRWTGTHYVGVPSMTALDWLKRF